MIIRRQLYTNNKLPVKRNDNSEMEIKRLLPTKKPQTHTGTVILRDVDDLLKPIPQKQKLLDRDEVSALQNRSSKERAERNLWRNDEVMEMLYTMQQVKALEKLNDKTVKSENVFKDVELIMHRNGYVKKSHVQIWTKWKFLKSTYMTSRRNGVIPRIVAPQVYETIHQMITGLNQSIADSCSSVDGDASSVSGMVISGVEGGVSDAGVTNGDDEDSFGMAHPIFGFRLGMVKSEPEDTGYENVETNGSDKDPLEDELSSSKSDKQVKEEDNSKAPTTNKEPEPVQRVLEVPHRGRGRPPKNPPAATSTPNNTPSPATKPAQMPPLRVAPFAKSINSANAIEPNRPPPPLTMPPTPRIRVTNLSNLKNSDPATFAQPKLTPKPTYQQQSPSVLPTRVTKEITVQSRASSSPSPSYPKMKQIPMRKTPYSLRPDRAIPDLEASLSPPPPPIEKTTSKRLEEMPTIKKITMQSNFQNYANRKKRPEWEDPVPSKQAKYNRMDEERYSSNSYSNDDTKNYGKVLQNVIIDLSSSLRKMQTEMMRDFFNKQNELLEREHKFQMQQDQLIMKAFQDQTQEIMYSVKQLVGNIKNYKSDHQNEGREIEKVVKANEKSRIQQKNTQEIEEEREDPIQVNEEDEDNEMDAELEQEEEHEVSQEQECYQETDQEAEDLYSDGEEQQHQLEEEHDREVIENNAEEIEDDDNQQQVDEDQLQLTDDQNENGLTPQEQDNSHADDCVVSNELNEN